MLITLTYRVRLPNGITGPKLTFTTDKVTAERDPLAYAVAEVQSELDRYHDKRRTVIPLHITTQRRARP